MTNDFFRVGEGGDFSIGWVREEAEHAFFAESGHAMQISWFANRCEIEFEVSGTNNIALRGMNNDSQRFWNRVGCTEESDAKVFESQLGIVVDFV